MIAHVGGAPVEETLLPLLSSVGGVGAGLLLARSWVASRVRRRQSPVASVLSTSAREAPPESRA